MKILLIALFGSVGVLARFWLNEKVGAGNVHFFKVTLFLNVIGSLFIGFFYASQKSSFFVIPEFLYLPLMVGLLGGLTTFSGFSLDTLKLLQNDHMGLALVNIILSVSLSLSACYLGMRGFVLFSK